MIERGRVKVHKVGGLWVTTWRTPVFDRVEWAYHRTHCEALNRAIVIARDLV